MTLALDGSKSHPPLATLGKRICVLGPSNSGKSTLAAAIARRLGRDVVHLDQLFHIPGTDWVARPYAEFEGLHARAIARERWVMDGNYSGLWPQRLQRATGVIVLDVATGTSLLRYLRRSWFQPGRVGGLGGGLDSVKWEMLRFIVAETRVNRRRYLRMFGELELPKVRLRSVREIRRAYRAWRL